MIKLKTSKSANRFVKIFNKKLSASPSVWVKAMDNPKGAKAIVYTQNGLVYSGALIDYSVDMNENDRDVILYGYKVQFRKMNDSFELTDICNHDKDYSKKVYLNREQIEVIEIHESGKKKEK